MLTVAITSKVLAFALVLSVAVSIPVYVEADSNMPIQFSGFLTLYSPVNQTYDSNVVTLNLTVECGVPTTLSYNIDNEIYQGFIPLEYQSGFIPNSTYTGVTELPELPQGQHSLTIVEKAQLSDYHGANPPGAPFKEIPPGSANWTATWIDKVDFSISSNEYSTTSTLTPTVTTRPAPTVPELSWLVIVPLLLSVFIVDALVKNRKSA